MIWRSLTGRDYSILDVVVATVVGVLYGLGSTTPAVVLLIGWGAVMFLQRYP